MFSKYDNARRLRLAKGIRDSYRAAKRGVIKYGLIGTAVLGFAYASDKCNAGQKMETGVKNGIEYVLK